MTKNSTTRFGCLLALLVFAAAGCYPSENPIWTPDTLVYYPDLLGTYQDDTPAGAKNTTTLEKGDAEKSYRLISRDGAGKKTGEAVLRLVKLDDTLFYDYQPIGAKLDAVKPPLKEFHFFGRLTAQDGKITLYSFGASVPIDRALRWKTVRPAASTGPATTRPAGETQRIIVNTTAELQTFLKENAKRMNTRGGSLTRLHGGK